MSFIGKSPFNMGAVAKRLGVLRGVKMTYIPYNKKLKNNARKLRNNATNEENKLWYQYLTKHSKRFLRQKIIDSYIVDFYCPEKKLAIEIDGSQHYTKEGIEYDNVRSNVLKSYNIKVIRITNYEINKKFREVCEYIDYIVNK